MTHPEQYGAWHRVLDAIVYGAVLLAAVWL